MPDTIQLDRQKMLRLQIETFGYPLKLLVKDRSLVIHQQSSGQHAFIEKASKWHQKYQDILAVAGTSKAWWGTPVKHSEKAPVAA